MSQTSTCLIFTVFLTLFLVGLPTGHAFRCWFCNTETDPKCGDPFNATASHRSEDCNPYYSGTQTVNRYVCRKVKYHKPNNEVAVSRMCVLDGERENNPCSAQTLSTYLRVEHCSTCDTDLCNSAPTLFKVSSLFGPIIVLLSKFNFL